jgi:hypothetical protein
MLKRPELRWTEEAGNSSDLLPVPPKETTMTRCNVVRLYVLGLYLSTGVLLFGLALTFGGAQ